MLSNLADPSDLENETEGLDVGATQEITTPSGPVWLIPGSLGMCVMTVEVFQGGAGADNTCDTNSNLSQGLGAELLNRSGAVEYFGVAPDGSAVAQVTGANGARKSVAVTQNAYILKVSRASIGSTRDARIKLLK